MSAKSKRRRSARYRVSTVVLAVLGVVLFLVCAMAGTAVYVESATACPITIPGGDR